MHETLNPAATLPPNAIEALKKALHDSLDAAFEEYIRPEEPISPPRSVAEAHTVGEVAGSGDGGSNYPTRRCKYNGSLCGQKFGGGTLPIFLIEGLLLFHAVEPQVLPRVARMVDGNGRRRLVARRPEELYLASPHLAEKYAEIVPGWFLATNIGSSEVWKLFRLACEATEGALSFGIELKLDR